ncbi:hypothetical protein [Mediterraneibacter gnavus]|nr:hypothetical protein [Mediterraneibacter gnavus]
MNVRIALNVDMTIALGNITVVDLIQIYHRNKGRVTTLNYMIE